MLSISAATALLFFAVASIIKYSVGLKYIKKHASFAHLSTVLPMVTSSVATALLLVAWINDGTPNDEFHFHEAAVVTAGLSTMLLFGSIVYNVAPTLAYSVLPTILILQYAVYNGVRPRDTKTAVLVVFMLLTSVVSITSVLAAACIPSR